MGAGKRQLFWVVFRPCRADLHATMTADEQLAIEAHLKALVDCHDRKQLEFAGRAADASHGVAVFEVADVDELNALLADNPACRAGVLRAEIQPYRGPR